MNMLCHLVVSGTHIHNIREIERYDLFVIQVAMATSMTIQQEGI